jgi:hypothetical protein
MLTLPLMLSASSATPGPAPHLALPALFSDHMVLRQGCRVPIWGTAAPGGPHVLRVAGGPDTLTLSDVMAGEAWLAPRQSNMEMPVLNWGGRHDRATGGGRATSRSCSSRSRASWRRSTDIQPRNKQEVGRRLALAALHLADGRDTVATGPARASTAPR